LPNHLFPLTELGERQARVTGEFLRTHYGEFDACYTSTFLRTQETFKLMYPGQEYKENSCLDEMMRGAWHTLSKKDIQEHFPFAEKLKEREGYYHDRAIGGGENGVDAEVRIRAFFDMLIREHVNDMVLCVTHGRLMVLIQNVIESLGWREVERLVAERDYCRNCAVLSYAPVVDKTSKQGLYYLKKELDMHVCEVGEEEILMT
jgi:broad specificity phosphatase PhoE